MPVIAQWDALPQGLPDSFPLCRLGGDKNHFSKYSILFLPYPQFLCLRITKPPCKQWAVIPVVMAVGSAELLACVWATWNNVARGPLGSKIQKTPSALSIRWHCVAMSLCKFTQYSLQWATTITPQIAPSPWPASILHCLHFVYVGSCSLHSLQPCCNKNIDFSWFQILRWQCLHLISTRLLITRPLLH